MNEQPRPQSPVPRYVMIAIAIFVLVAIGLGGWFWWSLQEQDRLRREAHRGLEGTWIDDTGEDVSYQFREDGEFLVRRKLPGTLAPFSGDPGIDHRPWGKWTRDGQKVSVQTKPNWGFDLILGEDGQLRGEYFLDSWSGQREHSRSTKPVVLKRKP